MPSATQIELPERYRVARHIASGGMASVWEARDLLLRRTVAVKVLGAHFAQDSGARERFQREARTAAQISDRTHIVTIYDIGEHRQCAFIVMEYCAGGTVADRLRAARGTNAGIARDSALRWLREAAEGLDVAHAAEIVHRDVKPANLMLDAQERLAVGDFGIARLADDTQMTQTGQVLGTAAYLSPEQALGRAATAASDRYALAVVAYELLTGARPFSGGPPAAQARQHVEAPPPRASQAAPALPQAIDAVLIRGLAKEPSERPTTATAFVGELERALETPSAATIEPTRRLAAIVPTQPKPKRNLPRPQPSAREPSAPERDRPTPRPTPIAPAAGPRPAAGSPPEPNGRRRERRLAPLVLLAAAALVIGVIAALAAGGDDKSSSRGEAGSATKARSTKTTAASTPKKAAPKPAAAQPTTTPSAPTGADPVALNNQGYALIQRKQYAAAIPFERQAVAGYRARKETSGTNYAYAIYNLGTALNRSGASSEAIPYLEERLRISNDRPGEVKQELAAARTSKKKPKP
jgi:serine/threonine protein kinase